MEVAIATAAIIRMNDILAFDAKVVFEGLGKDSRNQFWRRTFVRTMFANIEAQLSMMKQLAVRCHRLDFIKLSEIDLRKLADEIQLIWDASHIPGQPIRLPLIENVKFALKVFSSIPIIQPISVDTSSQGWQSLVIAVSVRDRLTHPKTEHDLFVTDSDVSRILAAWKWFGELTYTAYQITLT